MMLEQGRESNAQLRSSIRLYNKLLNSGLKTFRKSNPSTKAILVDTSVAFKKAIDHPKSYGAPDALCTNPDGESCVCFEMINREECANLLLVVG